jgi:S1-C subfamily serine protease
MKNQKGFAKTSIILAIIAGILILGGVSYFSFRYVENKPTEIPQITTIQATSTSDTSEIDQLKQEVEQLKTQVGTTPTSTPKPSSNTNTTVSQDISAADLQPYLDTVGVVNCFDADNNEQIGTAVLYKNGELLTNWHVIDGMETCLFVNDKFINPKYTPTSNNYRPGAYILDLTNAYRPDEQLDFAIVPFSRNENGKAIAEENGAPSDEYLEVNQLDYKAGTMTRCSEKAAIGTPVAIIGYPASSINLEQWAPPESVTTGIISGYEASYQSNNYLVSAKVDHGNSGGLALGKENGKICFLGIPTWVVTGEVESTGIVQNIRNLLN